jgi:signal transduction histidine kinase
MKQNPSSRALLSEVTLLRKRVLMLEKSAGEANRLIDSLQSFIRRSTCLHEIEDEHLANQLRENIIQDLAALNLSIESIIRVLPRQPDAALSLLIELQPVISRLIQDIRHFSHRIKPEVLNCLGLVESLESLIDDMRSQYRVDIGFLTRGPEKAVSSNIKTGLYHIAGEALKNACQHSRALKVRMLLCFNNRSIKLRITDNGQGFEIPDQFVYLADSGKIGLINIENWTSILNGKFRIMSRVNRGTVIIVEVPN